MGTLRALIVCATVLSVAQADESGDRQSKGDFEIQLQTIHSGYDRKTCWVHPRAGMIPGNSQQGGDLFTAVLTMHELRISGSDVYYPIHDMRTDDGGELGSYNTQTHWLTLGDRLYLVYTRRGANNDHIPRHRAPLFIARFDPDRPCVIRDSERIAVICEKYGSDNSIFVAKVRSR